MQRLSGALQSAEAMATEEKVIDVKDALDNVAEAETVAKKEGGAPALAPGTKHVGNVLSAKVCKPPMLCLLLCWPVVQAFTPADIGCIISLTYATVRSTRSSKRPAIIPFPLWQLLQSDAQRLCHLVIQTNGQKCSCLLTLGLAAAGSSA